MPARARITVAIVAAAVAATAVAAHAADQNVPKLTNATATPKRFCAKSSDACSSTGTTIRFTLSTPARVIADIRPRSHNIWGYREFERKFPAGRSSVRLNDTRLTPGHWTLKMQPVNSVGANGPTLVELRVIK